MLRQRVYSLCRQWLPKSVKKFDVEYSPTEESPENEEKYAFMLYLLVGVIAFSSLMLAFVFVILSLMIKIGFAPSAIFFSLAAGLFGVLAMISLKSQRIEKKLLDPSRKLKYKITVWDGMIPLLIAGIFLMIFLLNIM